MPKRPDTESPRFLVDVVGRLVHHRGFHWAASASYRSLFAFFPFLVFLLSVLALFGQAENVGDGIDSLQESGAFPTETAKAITSQLDKLAEGRAGSHVQSALIALALAVWSASAGMRAVMLGLNHALELEEHRSRVRRVLTSVVLGVVTGLAVLLATVIVAGGPNIAVMLRDLPGDAAWIADVWRVLRWPLVALLLFAWLALIASVGPATRQRYRLVTRGNLIALTSWIAFTLAFSWYVDNLGEQGHIYGVFAGAVVLMLHAYWSSLIIFIGAEIDGMHRAKREARR